MLVLTRKQDEKIQIGNDVVITVIRTKGKAVRLGIEAPGHVNILRGELVFELANEQPKTPLPQMEKNTKLESPKDRPTTTRGNHSQQSSENHRKTIPRHPSDNKHSKTEMPLKNSPTTGPLHARVKTGVRK